jgi:hypothetical protein
MALERTFQILVDDCCSLQETLSGLRQFVVEDKPTKPENAAVDELANAVEEAVGCAAEVVAASVQGSRAVGRPADLELARQELVRCQEGCHRLLRRYFYELASYERIAQLKMLSREHGGEWRGWARGVQELLGRCRGPLDDVQEALFLCWQELAERAGGVSLSVQSTKIGKQRLSVKSQK